MAFASDHVACAAVRRDADDRPALVFSEYQSAADEVQRQKSLFAMLRQYRRQRLRCHGILPIAGYQTQQIDIANMSAEEGRQAAYWQLADRLDYPVDEAIIDIYRITPFGEGKRPYHYAVAAPCSRLRPYVNDVKAAGFKLASLDLPEFALRNIAELFVEDVRGVAVLLMLEQTGLLVVARDGNLYLSRQLNIGMTQLLDSSPEERAVRFDSIVLDIQRSFDYCESTLHLPPVSRLLVAATVKELPSLIDYLDRLLVVRAEPLNLAEVMDVPAEIDPLQLHQRLLAIGGALRQEED